VSRHILQLEEELEHPLFLRIGRQIRITPTGETLLQLSRRVFADIDETRSRVVDRQQKLRGTLRLVGGMTVCLYVFPALLSQYRRLHPEVEVKVTAGATPALIGDVRAGTADLGLITLPIDDPALVTKPVMREELLLIMWPSHRLSQKRRVQVTDLHGEPLILFEAGSATRRVIDAFFVRQQITPHIVTETENVEIIKAMVGIGLGVSIVPYQAVAREVRAGTLACARIAGEALVRETAWVYLQAKRVPRSVEEMMSVFERVRPRFKLSLGSVARPRGER
jgi:DNA-binding transcriptional LysR family regulator